MMGGVRQMVHLSTRSKTTMLGAAYSLAPMTIGESTRRV